LVELPLRDLVYAGETIWSQGGRVGVRFHPRNGAEIVPLRWAKLLRTCEAENAVLRERLGDLQQTF
jgi:hypothetical protein